MPFWTFGTIAEEPEVRLVHWRVLEASYVDPDMAATRHFVGADAADRTGRVSSSIQELDAVALRGVTQSGRAYGLLGESRYDSEAEYVWNKWCRINNVATWVDVTKDAFTNPCDAMAVREIKPSATREAP